jgi:hypothetical protein
LDERTKAKKEAYIEPGESVILSHSELVKLVLVMLYIGAGGTGKDI